MHAVSVIVPVAIDRPYTYVAAEPLPPGTIVAVPLGPRLVVGAVWDAEVDPSVPRAKLREIAHVYPVPPLDRTMRAFVDWVARWTLAPPGMVLRMVLRSAAALEPEPERAGVVLAGAPPERLTPARARVLEILADGLAWTRPGLAASAGVSPSVIDGLVAAGTLAAVTMRPAPTLALPDPGAAPPALSGEQGVAAAALVAAVAEGGFSATLLEGVTGSGKTAVFLEAVAEAIARGRQALVMMPEIALTQSVVERFEERFAARPGEWHSMVPAKSRARVWRGVAEGDVRVVIGARSALFLPFRELGLLVVDEEHDGAYKQDDGVAYHARDMAVVRAHLGRFPAVLASATPSVESRVNAEQGRYRHVRLSERYAGAAMPEIAAIDLRRHPPPRGRWLSAPLVEATRAAIAAGGQALLFLNRRGYAPLTLCGACGHRFQCPNCSAWLVEHRLRGTLNCHHCGHVEPRPEACPSCGVPDRLVACGPGVERIAEEAAALFPEARLLVLSSDVGGGPERLRRELALVAEGKVDLVVGTQLVAKGHTFPKLSLVGVVDADLGLANGDPRAGERTFQLLAQVTGRAGRTGGRGRGLLQTHAPGHPVIAALVAGDAEAFYRAEIDERRRNGLPPFGRLAAIVVSGPERQATSDHARALARAAPASTEGIRVYGPAEAALAVVRGRHRFRLLVHAPRQADLQGHLRRWLAAAPPARGSLRVAVDVDPQSFL